MHTKDQPKDGRTPGYDAEIAETICERLVNGESLRAICADPAMPARATVFRWLARNQEFRRSYALARQCQAEDFALTKSSRSPTTAAATTSRAPPDRCLESTATANHGNVLGSCGRVPRLERSVSLSPVRTRACRTSIWRRRLPSFPSSSGRARPRVARVRPPRSRAWRCRERGTHRRHI